MKRPFLGCAYYPEDWNESEIEKDIAKMRKAGISCVRLAEFAWHKMEPTENEYNFTWLHNVIDKLYDNGISVILGTPTATPPRWLSKKYPDIFIINESGVSRSFGGRCDCCSNNAHYLEACDKIVKKMGEEFGSDKNVIAWQIDNEVYVRSNCFCNDCVRKLREHLRDKYKTIENLNKEWDLELWSQAYDSFEDIPTAGTMAWHNFHLAYECEVSHHQSNIDFIHRQADILRKYTSAKISTDMMPLNGMDYEQTVSKLDIVYLQKV